MTRSPGLHAVDGVLIAHAPPGFDDEAFIDLKKDVLAAVHASSLKGVVIDAARVELLDTHTFGILSDTARMAGLLGARVLFVGFGPGVVSSIMDMDVDVDAIECASTLEDALELMRPEKPAPTEAQEEDGGEDAVNDAGEDDRQAPTLAGPDARKQTEDLA